MLIFALKLKTKTMDYFHEFVNDLYDLLGMNTNFITQRDFFDKYILTDNAFMVDGNKIYLDDYTIIVKENKK